MSDVFLVRLVLINEKEPSQVLATKVARVHSSDLEAGEYMLGTKSMEILRDVRFHAGLPLK